MAHRSGRGRDPETGDGAGILVAMPDRFLRAAWKREAGLTLPARGRYAVGNVFLPRDLRQRQICEGLLGRYVAERGQRLLGWRDVPTDPARAGAAARATAPCIRQLVIGAAHGIRSDTFERQLYLIRKQAYHEVRANGIPQVDTYHVCSLSSRVLVYKGQLTSAQLGVYYRDLADATFASELAMFHTRFSTNTFPSWSRAQPMRFVGHNGEINTLRGNVNWMRARQALLRSARFGADLEKLYPIIDAETSDSGIFDNVIELLVMSGRSLPEAIMMMVPEAWENDHAMPADRRAFYEYHANLMEPWDGPALVTFTDGRHVGAVLDRNGLRPGRYVVTNDGRIIMASEAGVVDVPPERVLRKGRLQPGKIFLVDLKGEVHRTERYSEGPGRGPPPLCRLARPEPDPAVGPYATRTAAARPRDADGASPGVRLHDRAALLPAPAHGRGRPFTNPPIDSIREALVMSLACPMGPAGRSHSVDGQ
jgi:glutamate synthase (NADPH) large chain